MNPIGVTAASTTSDKNGRPLPNDPYFGIIHMGDWHHLQSGGTNDDATDALNIFNRSIDTIIANKTAWNVRMLITPGDLVDATYRSNGVNPKFPEAVAQIRRLQDAGIDVVVTPGNHDIYQPDWNSNITKSLLLRNDSFTGETRERNDTTSSVYLLTNGALRLGVIALNYFSGASLNWVLTTCNKYPTYQFILATHAWVDSYGIFPAAINSGTTVDEVKQCKNLFAVWSGHYRGPFANALSFMTNNFGNTITNNFLNTQQMTSSGKNYFQLHRVYASHVHATMFDSRLGRFMANGETAERPSTTKNTKLGWYHDFCYPINGSGTPAIPIDAPQFINNTDFIGGVDSTSAMTQTGPTVVLPYTALRPTGTIGTWALVTNEVKPRFSVT